MKLKTVDRIYGILVVTGAALILLGFFVFDNMTIVMVGAGLGCVGCLVGLLFAKCPYCGKKLTMRFGAPSYCPSCGKKIK